MTKKLLIFIICILTAACSKTNAVNPNLTVEMPPVILWAWERPEDLRFIDTTKFGAAFLAQTIVLRNEEIIFKPRRQPLEVAPQTYLIAVTRIETIKDTAKRPAFSDEQKTKIISLITKSLELPEVQAVQIDFDVVRSERKFYRELVSDLRKELPENTPLTITSLASWCVGDTWFNDFPIDEAVPMAFRMGADSAAIREFLAKENDWNEPLCRGSYGISIDEPLKVNFRTNRRKYVFNAKSWQPGDLEKIY